MVAIGTVDLPERIDRERYFRELSYMELSLLFAGPPKPSTLEKWKVAPRGSLGLVAPWVLTHKTPPKAMRLWTHDATVGPFRDSTPARAAIGELRVIAEAVGASCIVFRSPPLFAPSADNRATMQHFFSEVATPEKLAAPIVWVPDGLWEPLAAIHFASELGIACAIDPLVREPGQPLEIYEDLDVSAIYWRISGLGRSGPIRSERQEDLAALIESYATVPTTIAFDSPQRWQDARNLKKLLEVAT